jgi:hypothetical protein
MPKLRLFERLIEAKAEETITTVLEEDKEMAEFVESYLSKGIELINKSKDELRDLQQDLMTEQAGLMAEVVNALTFETLPQRVVIEQKINEPYFAEETKAAEVQPGPIEEQTKQQIRDSEPPAPAIPVETIEEIKVAAEVPEPEEEIKIADAVPVEPTAAEKRRAQQLAAIERRWQQEKEKAAEAKPSGSVVDPIVSRVQDEEKQPPQGRE